MSTPMRPENFDDLIAEQAAQQQVLLMALRRIAALTRAAGDDVEALSARWVERGRAGLDKTTLRVAEGHESAVRRNAKMRLEEIIEIGLR